GLHLGRVAAEVAGHARPEQAEADERQAQEHRDAVNHPRVVERLGPRHVRAHGGEEGLRRKHAALPGLDEALDQAQLLPPLPRGELANPGDGPSPGRRLAGEPPSAEPAACWPRAGRLTPAATGGLGRLRHVHLLPAVGAELDAAPVRGEDGGAARATGVHRVLPRSRRSLDSGCSPLEGQTVPRAYSMQAVQHAASRAVELVRAFLLSDVPGSQIHDVQDDPRFQHRGVDLLWERPGKEVLGVEVKGDRQGRRGTFFLELISNAEKDTPGCFLYSRADLLAYVFLDRR